MTLQPGSRPVPNAPDYVLIRKLGAGAFGEVWHAHGPGCLDVALKFIRLDSHGLALELRSLEAVKSIRHPNLVSLFGAWHKDNWLILAMELCDRSLQERLAEALDQQLPGIPLEELLRYMADAANGLDALNAKQVQHRDVKPANLLLLDSGVKVADFGLAKALEQTVASNSGAGTLAYTAPECFKGQLTQQSDQYSLAITFYHLRTGRLLFQGAQAQVMYAHLELEPDLSRLPPAERVIVARALSKEPDKRWASCKAFVSELIMLHEPIRLTNNALVYYERGVACLDKGDSDEAIKNFDEAIRFNPNIAAFYNSRGEAWLAKSEERWIAWSHKKAYDNAIQDFDEAIRLNPNIAGFYNSRGMTWLYKKENDKAIRDFNEAIHLDPTNAYDSYCWRAEAWSDKKAYDKAVKDLNEAIRINPNEFRAYAPLAWLLATCPDEKVRDGKRAIQMATKAAELARAKYGEYGAKYGDIFAAAYAEAGQFDEAVRYQTKELEDANFRWSNVDEIRHRLELYKQKQPFRQSN